MNLEVRTALPVPDPRLLFDDLRAHVRPARPPFGARVPLLAASPPEQRSASLFHARLPLVADRPEAQASRAGTPLQGQLLVDFAPPGSEAAPQPRRLPSANVRRGQALASVFELTRLTSPQRANGRSATTRGALQT